VGAEAHRCDDRREPLVEALADPGPHRGVVRRGDELGELAGGEAAPHDDGIEVAGERVRVGDARVVADAERAERHRAEERGTIERGERELAAVDPEPHVVGRRRDVDDDRVRVAVDERRRAGVAERVADGAVAVGLDDDVVRLNLDPERRVVGAAVLGDDDDRCRRRAAGLLLAVGERRELESGEHGDRLEARVEADGRVGRLAVAVDLGLAERELVAVDDRVGLLLGLGQNAGVTHRGAGDRVGPSVDAGPPPMRRSELGDDVGPGRPGRVALGDETEQVVRGDRHGRPPARDLLRPSGVDPSGPELVERGAGAHPDRGAVGEVAVVGAGGVARVEPAVGILELEGDRARGDPGAHVVAAGERRHRGRARGEVDPLGEVDPVRGAGLDAGGEPERGLDDDREELRRVAGLGRGGAAVDTGAVDRGAVGHRVRTPRGRCRRRGSRCGPRRRSASSRRR
jgi:hypothetical protein